MVSITSCLQGVLVRRHPVNVKFRRTEVIKEVWGPVLDTRVFNIGVLLFMTDYFCLLEVLVLFPLDSLGAESKNFLNPVLPVQSYLLSLIRSDEMPGELQPHHDVDDQRYCQHQQDGNRCCTETHAGFRATRSFFIKNISFLQRALPHLWSWEWISCSSFCLDVTSSVRLPSSVLAAVRSESRGCRDTRVLGELFVKYLDMNWKIPGYFHFLLFQFSQQL